VKGLPVDKIAIIDLLGTLGGSGFGDILSFSFYDFAFAALRELNAAGINIIIYTNHSRISQGLLSLDEFLAKKDALLFQLGKAKISVGAFLFCPHTDADGCECRKPKTGLIRDVLASWPVVDLANSYVIGDMGKSDMLLAKNLGAKGILVKTGVGKASLKEIRNSSLEYEPFSVQETILTAAEFIRKDVWNT
jgi:D-glycero-D-manno-heptose 1,7-bisphosphate phosphatase